MPGVPDLVQAALFLAQGSSQVLDPDAQGAQAPAGPERVIGEFPELHGHRPAPEFGMGNYRGAVPDLAGELNLAQPGRAPEGCEEASRFGAGCRGSSAVHCCLYPAVL